MAGSCIPIRKFIGIPYADKGRDFNGCDCWGLVLLWYKHMLGETIPDYVRAYSSAEDKANVELAMLMAKRKWEKRDAEPAHGDVVLFRVRQYLCHSGVALGDGTFLHVLNGRNSTIEPLFGFMWKNNIEGVYRWTATR